MDEKNLSIEDLFWIVQNAESVLIKELAFLEMITRKDCPIKYVWEIFLKEKDRKIESVAKKWFKEKGSVRFCVLQHLGLHKKYKNDYDRLIKFK